MRRLWTEDKVTHKGRFYTVTDAGISLKPARPGGVPIWMAAQVDAAIRRVARIGDAWMIVPATGSARWPEQMRALSRRAGASTAASRRMRSRSSASATSAPATDGAGRMPRAAGIQIRYLCVLGHGCRGEKPPFEDYARDRFIIGDAAFVQEEVARYRETLGVDHFMMRCHWPGLEQEKVLGSIRRLGEIFA